jgi:hypothetical protein
VPDNVYFAAVVEPEEFGERFVAKVDEYFNAGAVKAIHERIEKAYQYHFGLSPEGLHLTSGVTRGGEQGELAEVRVNHVRANSLTVLNLTVAPKVAWIPVATNGDSSSTKQAIAGVSLLDYYWLAREAAAYAQQAVAHCIPLTEGFVFSPWDDSLGEDVASEPELDPETGEPTGVEKPVKSGDFAFYNVMPWDVMRDPAARSWEQCRWVAVRLYQNRYELAAQHPEHADAILEAPVGADDADRTEAFGESDDIGVWYYFHKRSPIPELRKGREARILADGTVIKDGVLTYDEIPLHRVVPDEHFGTPFGYSQYHDGIGLQEAIDSLTSAILTNQDAFARQMIAVKAGESATPEDFGGGKVYVYNTEKPTVLQLCSSPAEAFKFVDTLKSDLQRIQGVNDAVQGQLPGDAKLSGAALALLSSQAIQQNSTLQANYVKMVRSIGNCVLNEWKKRTSLPRKIQLLGRSNEFLCREEEMSGADISDIKAVKVDIGNPLQQTHAGKMELVQLLLTIPGAITSPEQVIQLTQTGRLEHLVKGTRDELVLILDENEAIADGKVPQAVIHDDHLRHGREHRSTLASVAARENPAIVKASIEHLHQHYCLFFGWPDPMMPPPLPPLDPMTGMPDPTFNPADPTNDPLYRERMLILVGQQPPPPMGPMGMPMGAPPDAGGTPPPGTPGANPEKPPELAGNQTNLPTMPNNPLTGDDYVPPGGETTVD